jgi:hypothetical protein
MYADSLEPSQPCSSSTSARGSRPGTESWKPSRRTPSPASTTCSTVCAPVRASTRCAALRRNGIELSTDCTCALRSHSGAE